MIKKNTDNYTSALLIFYLVGSSRKSKEKGWVLLFFFKWAFLKNASGFFWVVFLQQPWLEQYFHRHVHHLTWTNSVAKSEQNRFCVVLYLVFNQSKEPDHK